MMVSENTAKELFKAHHVLSEIESDIYDWLIEKFGSGIDDTSYDAYDDSLELHGCHDSFEFDQEKAEEVFKLGFKRMWVGYHNKPEQYFYKKKG